MTSSSTNEEKTFFSWEAPERSFQRKDRDFWITAIAILVLFSVILIFIKEFYLIIALISALFLYYVLSTVPPEKVTSKITNRGIYFGPVQYPWDFLSNFWFAKSLSSDVLRFSTALKFPRQLTFVIDPQDKEKLTKIITKHIPLVESSPGFIDNLSAWFSHHLPLENREK